MRMLSGIFFKSVKLAEEYPCRFKKQATVGESSLALIS